MHTVLPSNREKSSTCDSLTRAFARARRTHVWIMVTSCWTSPGQTVLPTCVRVQAKASSAEERRSEGKNADCACLRACR
jgi:hypothetical protein